MADALPGLPFQITGVLGKGGMGVVYRARDPSLDRELAIKVPSGRMSGARRERFLREGQVTAALEHPGILRVHAAGVLDDERPWLAYELVEEPRALDAMWGEQSLEERVHSIRDAARAVGHAHRHGVIHRDIKADNVLVDQAGHVRVADFGLALTAGQDRLTQTGALLGTPTMMSPEQLSASKELGPETDVWALGVLLYQALTNEYPFDYSGGLQSLIASVSKATPTPPRRLRPDVPRALEKVVLRCLHKDPDSRFANGESLADAIEAAMVETADPSRRLALIGFLVVGGITLAGIAATQAPRFTGSRTTKTASPAPVPTGASAPTLTPEERKVAEAERLLTKDPEAAGALLREAAAAGHTGARRRLTALLAAGRIDPLPGEDVIKLLQRDAAEGHPPACYQLALRLQDGRGLPHDPERAVVLLERAAKAGHAAAAGALALALRVGRGVLRNNREAVSWARRAAKADEANGLSILSGAYLKGFGGIESSRTESKRYIDRLEAIGHPLVTIARSQYEVPVDPVAAMQTAKKGASLDYPQAIFLVGYYYETGTGVPTDEVKARRWYEKAAAVKDRQALQILARYLIRGRGGPADIPRGVSFLRELVRRGFPKAMFDLARCYEEALGVKRDRVEATRLFRRAADRGHAPSAYRIAQYYEDGRGVIPPDPPLAARYYKRSLRWGHTQAYAGLAQLYKLGHGVKQDQLKAFELFKQGAERGDSEAAHRLGLMYMRGVPVKQDLKRAATLFRAAADARHPKASWRLGLILEQAEEPDMKEVIRRYELAVRFRVPGALVRLAELLLEGKHVKKDAKRAKSLLKQAADKGDEKARELLRGLGG